MHPVITEMIAADHRQDLEREFRHGRRAERGRRHHILRRRSGAAR